MLVLSRAQSQSVIIDDTVEVQVIGIATESVEVVVLGLPEECFRRITLPIQTEVVIYENVSMTFICVSDEQRARIGITAPSNATIQRKEFRL